MRNPLRRAGIPSGVAGRAAAMAVVAGLLVAAVAVPVTGLVGVATRDAANTFNDLSVPPLGAVPVRSELLDQQGHLIAYYYPGGIYRVPVSYDQIAPVMRNAIVAIEDSRFFEHGAIDARGTFRAFVNDVNNDPVQGGSTLAQQYVKNALILSSQSSTAKVAAASDTPERKIRELRMAANVEHELTKDQLLAAYLDVAYFENNAYGIQVAAERYFSTDAAHLTLAESAMLAGLVENPAADDPMDHPQTATARRNVVLDRMAQLGYVTPAAANAAKAQPLGLKTSVAPLATGCASASQTNAFFCDYVLAVLRTDPAYKSTYQKLNTGGGLRIYTTMNAEDQTAASAAVNWVEPNNGSFYNPRNNADSEVLIQPGTGAVRAIAVNRVYGNGPGQDNIDYAVNNAYDGGAGVQTGSSSKLFTLITALEQGVPFGFTEPVTSPATISGYTNCAGQPLGPYVNLHNAEGASAKPTVNTLYNGTTGSINVFYAKLEQKVGLCNVVKTAVAMGVTRADGKSLLAPDGSSQSSADNVESFTLGSVNVSPMSMAGAYATVAARGVYCKPIAIAAIVDSGGAHLPVENASCHRVFSTQVADAADFILQGVITGGTAAGRGIGRPAAGKTGTSDGGFYAAFGGFTPTLAGYVSVFNPDHPTTTGAMIGEGSCYRQPPSDGGGQACSGQMFGADAPAATWQMTFLRAALGAPLGFVPVPGGSIFLSEGSGVNSPKPPPGKKPGRPGRGGGGGDGGGGGGLGGGPIPIPTQPPVVP